MISNWRMICTRSSATCARTVSCSTATVLQAVRKSLRGKRKRPVQAERSTEIVGTPGEVFMSDRTYKFVELDVFTQTPLAGNPLAVFYDARGLTDAEMQALAREMNLSETTYILPRDGATEAREGKKVRIFTVEHELPFAGHPTLGTALYLCASEHNQKKPAEITLDLKAGKIPVRFTADSDNPGRQRVDGHVFGEMRQRDPEFGSPLAREEVARVIGIAADEIASEWP